jgi:hypothetical protein
VLNMLMCSDGNCNHANPSANGRGRSQSASSAIQPVQRQIPIYPVQWICSLGNHFFFVSPI